MREWFKALSDSARLFIVGRPPPDEQHHQQELLNQSQQQLQQPYQQPQYQQQPLQQYQEFAYTETQYGPPRGQNYQQRRQTPSHPAQHNQHRQQQQPLQSTSGEYQNYQQQNTGQQQRIPNQGSQQLPPQQQRTPQQQFSSQHRRPQNNQPDDARSKEQDARLSFQAFSQPHQFQTPGDTIPPVGLRPESGVDQSSHDSLQVAAGYQPVYYIPVPVDQIPTGVISQSAPQQQLPDQFNTWGALQPVGSFQEQFFLQQQPLVPSQTAQVPFPQQPQQVQQWQQLPQFTPLQVGPLPSFGQQNFQGLQVPMAPTQPQGSQILNQIRPMVSHLVSPLPGRPHSPHVIRHQMTRTPSPGPFHGNGQNRMASPRPPLLPLPFLPENNKSTQSQNYSPPFGSFVPGTSVSISRHPPTDLPPTQSGSGIQNFQNMCKTTISPSVVPSEGSIRVPAQANKSSRSARSNRKSGKLEFTPPVNPKPMLDFPSTPSTPSSPINDNERWPSDDSLLDDGSLREGTDANNSNSAHKSDHLSEGSNGKNYNVGHKKKRRRRKKAPQIPVTVELIDCTNNQSTLAQTPESRPIRKKEFLDSLDTAITNEKQASDINQTKESQNGEKCNFLKDSSISNPRTPQIKRKAPAPPPDELQEMIDDSRRQAKESEQQSTACATPVHKTSRNRAKKISQKAGKQQKLTISASPEQLPRDETICLNDTWKSGKVVTAAPDQAIALQGRVPRLDDEKTNPNEITSTPILDERVGGNQNISEMKSTKKWRRKDSKIREEDKDDLTQNTGSASEQPKYVTELDVAVSPKPHSEGFSNTSTEQGRALVEREGTTKNNGGANYAVDVFLASGLATKALEGQLATIHSGGNIRRNYGHKHGNPGTTDNSLNDRDGGLIPSSDAKAAEHGGDDTTAECEVLGNESVECTRQANDVCTVDHQNGLKKDGEISVNGDITIEKDRSSITKKTEIGRNEKRQNTNSNKTKYLSESNNNQPDQLERLPHSIDPGTSDGLRSQAPREQQSCDDISNLKKKTRRFLTPQNILQGRESAPGDGNCADGTAEHKTVVDALATLPKSGDDNVARGICDEQNNVEQSAIHVIGSEAGRGDVKDSSCSNIDSAGGKTVPRGTLDAEESLRNVSDRKTPCETHFEEIGSDIDDTPSHKTLGETLSCVLDEQIILRRSSEVSTTDNLVSTKNTSECTNFENGSCSKINTENTRSEVGALRVEADVLSHLAEDDEFCGELYTSDEDEPTITEILDQSISTVLANKGATNVKDTSEHTPVYPRQSGRSEICRDSFELNFESALEESCDESDAIVLDKDTGNKKGIVVLEEFAGTGQREFNNAYVDEHLSSECNTGSSINRHPDAQNKGMEEAGSEVSKNEIDDDTTVVTIRIRKRPKLENGTEARKNTGKFKEHEEEEERNNVHVVANDRSKKDDDDVKERPNSRRRSRNTDEDNIEGESQSELNEHRIYQRKLADRESQRKTRSQKISGEPVDSEPQERRRRSRNTDTGLIDSEPQVRRRQSHCPDEESANCETRNGGRSSQNNNKEVTVDSESFITRRRSRHSVEEEIDDEHTTRRRRSRTTEEQNEPPSQRRRSRSEEEPVVSDQTMTWRRRRPTVDGGNEIHLGNYGTKQLAEVTDDGTRESIDDTNTEDHGTYNQDGNFSVRRRRRGDGGDEKEGGDSTGRRRRRGMEYVKENDERFTDQCKESNMPHDTDEVRDYLKENLNTKTPCESKPITASDGNEQKHASESGETYTIRRRRHRYQEENKNQQTMEDNSEEEGMRRTRRQRAPTAADQPAIGAVVTYQNRNDIEENGGISGETAPGGSFVEKIDDVQSGNDCRVSAIENLGESGSDSTEGEQSARSLRRRRRRRETCENGGGDQLGTDAAGHDGELSSTSTYGGSGKYGSGGTGSSIGSGYLSVLNRDRSGTRDPPTTGGYGSGCGSGSDYGKGGYSSGTGSRPYSSSRLGPSTDLASKGISAIASKFGETKPTRPSTGVTSPTPQTNSASTGYSARTRASDPTPSSTTSRTRDTIANDIPSRRTRETATTSSNATTPSYSRTRDSGATVASSNTTSTTTPSYSRTRDTTSTTLPRTRSRETNNSSTTFESPSTYTPKIDRLNSYDRTETGTLDRSGYNSGYASDARSGYGSDYKSGYNSGSNYSKYQPYSRTNSTLKDQESTYKPTYSRETSTYKPYSRENSFLGSDTGGGSSWRSRVYGTDNTESKPTASTVSPNPNANSTSQNNVSKVTDTSKKGSLDTSVFRDAIDKLTKAAKDDGTEAKKPEGVSPNAVRVLPIFNPGDVKLKNRAPADFTSASEGSDAEENKDKTEKNGDAQSSKNKVTDTKGETSPQTTPVITRPFRHLAAVTPLPTRPTATSTGLVPTPTFKLSPRFANKDTEAMPAASTTTSKWLRERDESITEDKSPSPKPSQPSSISAVANKDCRKSVLNMDINPAEQELMRKQQEEKREELRRLRRQRGEETKSTALGKPPKSDDGSQLSRTSAASVVEEDEHQSSEESKSEKPPVPPSVEKTNSRTRLVERKHSKGKSDGLRSSGSFRRVRDRQSSQNSKSSSSSSSESESESRLPRSKNSSFTRRRKLSRDDVVGSSGDSRPSSRVRTDSQSAAARRSRNNSESLCKTNSKSNLSKSRSGNNSRGSFDGEKSRSNSRTNLIGENKLSLGPDIDIGESTFTFPINKKRITPSESKESASSPAITRTKAKKNSESSSEDESSKSTESSESGSEEGHFFSLIKSKSMKKSKTSFHKLPSTLKIESRDCVEELGVRTSPDGKEQVSRNNSNTNMKSCNYEEGDDGVVTAKVTITLPQKCQGQANASSHSLISDLEKPTVNGDVIRSSSKNVLNGASNAGCEEFQWPSGSPELPRKKIEVAIAEQNGYDNFRWPSKSPELPRKEIKPQQENDGYDEFQWPSGSPELPRKKIETTTTNKNGTQGYDEFVWPSGSPELPRRNHEMASSEVNTGFQWPDGSPEMPRKRNENYIRTQWDTETETEMTEMEQTEWSDGSPKSGRRQMPQVAEETEDDDFNFEWPSSPEMSRRHPLMTQNSGYDTQNEMDAFEWGSSPELPIYKNQKYVTTTQNIDELINDQDRVEDNFDQLEKLYGFEVDEESDKPESTKTSRRSSKCSEKALTDVTDDRDEEDEEEGEDEEEDKKDGSGQISTNEDKKPNKESLRDRARNNLSIFFGKLTNIDDIVSSMLKPLTNLPASIKKKASPHLTRKHHDDNDTDADADPLDNDDSSIEEVDASDVKVHDAQANRASLHEHIEEIDASAVIVREKEKREALRAEIIKAVKEGLDDASLQVYRDGDYCTYLDLDTPLAQQAEDIDNITDSKKNAIILRTQLSVRVHAIIEKLNNSAGRELRRALFSLKQIFQDDKDLVHAFVQNDGLTCLVKVGESADQNYQNYILRALGQVMLYVDGMNGVAEHPETVQWLYSLIGSKYRLVVKTALKLLLVFVEYTESNSLVLVRAIENVDLSKGQQPWRTIMRLLEGTDGLDMELQTFAMTLINKTLNGIPDQDNYYDQTDWLEELGMEILVQKFLHNPNSDLDLLQQLTIYEAVMSYEDGDDECRTRTIDPTIRQMPRSSTVERDCLDRRKSRRHAGSPVPVKKITIKTSHLKVPKKDDRRKSSSDEEAHHFIPIGGGLPVDDLGGIKHADDGLTPALRRRRERAERQRTFLNEQQTRRGSQSSENNSSVEEESKNLEVHCLNQQATWMFEMLYGKSRQQTDEEVALGHARRESLTNIEGIASRISSLHDKEVVDSANNNNKKAPLEIKSAASVRELTEKMQKGITLTVAEQEKLARLGDITGRISKAKEDLNKAQTKPEGGKSGPAVPEPPKKSENDIQWENLVKHLNRTLELCDLDFTDLTDADDVDIMAAASLGNAPPPPPPPPPFMNGVIPPPPGGIPPPPPGFPPPPPPAGVPAPPPAPNAVGSPPPAESATDPNIPPPPPAPPSEGGIPPAPPLGSYGQHLAPKPGHSFGVGLVPILLPKKTKKTIKLFWNEVQKDPTRPIGVPTLWDEVQSVELDNIRLEHLFESRAKDINAKERQQDQKGVKELVVLDPKRSNVINIGMTKLPPPRTIKTAILNMDSSIINREGIEKLLSTMLPSAEEKQKIQEAAIANPEVPLGSAEQFLMMLSTISELPARLKLWLFKLDYELMEKEVAEPLMDLKQGISDLQKNKTFKILLSVLLSVGNFLNGSDAKGFQVEYLSKVPEVKDTVHKHSLLHHLCHMVIEKFPDTTDVYSEIGAITRASKVDFDDLASNIEKMEVECKASWDYLKVIAKHDGPTNIKLKMSEFLADCAERIIVLGIIYRRVKTRFQRFLTYLGTPVHKAKEAKAKEVCGVISEFALEYRTCRDRVQQQLQKKANHRERNKTRGKMIMEGDLEPSPVERLKASTLRLPRMEKFKPKPKTKEEKADSELRQLLNVADVGDNDSIRGKNTWRRTKEGGKQHRVSRGADDPLTAELLMLGSEGGEDALLDSLVRSATQAPQSRAAPRDRRRSRHADRKSSTATVKKSRTRERVLIQELEALHASKQDPGEV